VRPIGQEKGCSGKFVSQGVLSDEIHNAIVLPKVAQRLYEDRYSAGVSKAERGGGGHNLNSRNQEIGENARGFND